MHLQASLKPLAVAALTLAVSLSAAQAQPVSNSSLYYRMGGGSPSAGAPNRAATSMSLGINGRMNYSCGKFDVGLSWSNVMNNITNLGSTVSNAVKSGISALPLYALQRAQPGLYQLFQNFSQKVDLQIAAATKSCEEMEAMIKSGKDPYEDYIALAKGGAWKARASANGDIVQAKVDIDKNEIAQRMGLDWVFGQKAGGVGTDPIRPVQDLAVAGYNVTLNQPAITSAKANYSNHPSHSASRLVRSFKTAEELSQWTSDVLGDKKVYLCTQDSDCPDPTATKTATGLGPKYEQELQAVEPRLNQLAASSVVNHQALKDISAPGMAVTPQLMEAIQKLPVDTRAVVVGRLSQELSTYRVIEKALIARNVLITGLTLPEVAAATEVASDVQSKIDRLTQYINDLMFEFRIRKEMTADTALSILGEQTRADSASMEVPNATRAEQQKLQDGKVAQ